ncbi:MAG: helix-turn-helix domain-containing protein [Pseudomonadota bacterium]
MLTIQGSPGWNIQSPFGAPFNIYSQLITVLAWRFGMAVFDEDVQLGPIGRVLLGILVISFSYFILRSIEFYIGLPFEVPRTDVFYYAYRFISIWLLCHLAWRAYAGRDDDLVEGRRKHRTAFIIMIALTLLFVVLYAPGVQPFEFIHPSIQYAVALPASLWMLMWAAKLNPETMAFVPPKRPVRDITDARAARELELTDRLADVMEKDLVYREAGLSVSGLARRLGVPEHQLRALINGTLGYRNFSTFLNSYRIEDAKSRLADPREAHIPVLTIALDVGFASISPFNNAFKSMVGVTPTTYRRSALATPSSAAPRIA